MYKLEEIEVCDFKIEKRKIKVVKLTKNQRNCIDVIEAYKEKHKRVPTMRELANELGFISPGSICNLLERLKDKGYDYKKLNYDYDEENVSYD